MEQHEWEAADDGRVVARPAAPARMCLTALTAGGLIGLIGALGRGTDAIGLSVAFMGAGALITALISVRDTCLKVTLALAFALRLGLAFVQVYVAPLPDSTADAVSFERIGWEAAHAWLTGGAVPDLSGANLYSGLIGALYYFFGRVPLIPQFINVLFGVLTVLLVYKITLELNAPPRAARLAAFVATVFPTLNLYSAITLREAIIVFCTGISVYTFLKWLRSDSWGAMAVAAASLLLASVFHDGMLVVAMVYIVFFCLYSPRHRRWRVSPPRLLVAITIVAASSAFTPALLNKLPEDSSLLVSPEYLTQFAQSRAYSRATYLQNLAPHSVTDMVVQTPLRMAYLFFSPFPWMVSTPADLLGLADASLYLIAALYGLRGLARTWRGNRAACLALTIILLVVTAAFAWGTSNYGTAIRHRQKIAWLLIAMASIGMVRSRGRPLQRTGKGGSACLAGRENGPLGRPGGCRIVYLITGLNVGGAEMMLCRLVKGLDRVRFDPVVISLLPPGPVAEKIQAEGLPVYSLYMASKLDAWALWRLYGLLRRLDPVILHTFLFHANLLGRVVGRLAGVPVIISGIRSTKFGGRWRELALRWTDRWALRTVVVSRAAGDRMLRQGVVPPGKLRVIYNGLDVTAFPVNPPSEDIAGVRREMGVPPEWPLLLAVGRLQKPKGYPLLLEAMAILQERGVSCFLAVAGDGEMRAALEEQAVRLGLGDCVRFLGLRHDVIALMAGADALVLSSLWEGLPGAVLEAMAAGLPVVATAVGGTPELVVDGVTGFLVPPGDPAALAGAVAELLRLPAEKRKEMGQAGRRRVEENFTIDRMVRAYEDLYTECLALVQKGGLDSWNRPSGSVTPFTG